jgi:hypothetical protein
MRANGSKRGAEGQNLEHGEFELDFFTKCFNSSFGAFSEAQNRSNTHHEVMSRVQRPSWNVKVIKHERS